MKLLWCWRCRAKMPMLDEAEFAEMSAVYSACIRNVKSERQERGVGLEAVDLTENFRAAVCGAYRDA